VSYYLIYRDNNNQWRWHYVAANNKIIAVSSESYWNKADCLNAIGIMKRSGGDDTYER
jgi:uncharacterized protein YegP (UPF0339 family)